MNKRKSGRKKQKTFALHRACLCFTKKKRQASPKGLLHRTPRCPRFQNQGCEDYTVLARK